MNLMQDICPHKKSAPVLPEGTVTCTHLAACKLTEDAKWDRQNWC